jgi:hypothetical protein
MTQPYNPNYDEKTDSKGNVRTCNCGGTEFKKVPANECDCKGHTGYECVNCGNWDMEGWEDE